MVAAILRRNLGEKKSFELLTQGFEYTTDEALALGLINRVVQGDELETAVLDFASGYTKVSGSAVAMTKRLLYHIDADTFEAAIEKGVETNAEARMTEDCQKGIAKFLEK
jgi:methylglutaconyl-CoA hydratase